MLNRKHLLIITLAAFSIIFIWLASKSEFWTIEKIVIEGGFFVSDDRLLSRTSTADYGDNIFYFPASRLSYKLEKEIPQLARVTIRKNIITKELVITLEEKKPFINIIFYPRYYVIDDNGVILNVDEEGQVFDMPTFVEMPILTGIDEKLLKNKDKLPEEYIVILKSILKKFLYLLESDSIKVDVSNKKNITVMTGDLLDIKIGDMNSVDEKMSVFKILFEEVKEKKADSVYIDVRYPNHPVVKYER